jgi:D-3-phosphoglycerate dehydrogenase / 2-oxoglutarate reductase
MRILIVTHPFGQCGDEPDRLLVETGWDITHNKLDRRLKGDEVKYMLPGFDAVIAGTELYSEDVIEYAKDLRVISRVGIGLDNINYDACKRQNIKVAYTPDAPSDAVADLTVAQIFNLLRGIFISDKSVKNGQWNRIVGVSIKQIKIGILGVGRIGSRVIDRLKPFEANILACDINPNKDIDGVTWVDKDTIFKESDLVSIHIPLSEKNYHFVGLNEMSMMKEGSYIINTSRGPIINEGDLEACVLNNHFAGVALDVFEKEPYEGVLAKLDNVILTAHLASSDKHSRYLMELGAVENCIQLLKGENSKNLVTEDNFK